MHEHNRRVAADSNGLRATFEDIDVGRSLGDVLAQVEFWQVRRHSFQDHLSDKRFDTAANPYQSAKVYRKVIDMGFYRGIHHARILAAVANRDLAAGVCADAIAAHNDPRWTISIART